MNSPSAHVKLVWILGTSNPSCGTVPTPPLFALILHRGAEPHVVQESLASLELEAVGLPSHLAMRLGARRLLVGSLVGDLAVVDGEHFGSV